MDAQPLDDPAATRVGVVEVMVGVAVLERRRDEPGVEREQVAEVPPLEPRFQFLGERVPAPRVGRRDRRLGGLDRVDDGLEFPGQPQAPTLECLERFGEEVFPAV